MRIDVTVEAVTGSHHDVAVFVDESTSTRDVVARLADEICDGQTRKLKIDGKAAEIERDWQTQLRPGSIVSVSQEQQFPAPTARIVVAAGAQSGQVLAVPGRSVVIGRDPSCDLILTDPDVSREHARLTFDTTAIDVEDLSSTNGTSVDGVTLRAAKATVDEHCIIRIGNTALRIELGTPAAPVASATGAVPWPEQPPRSRPSSPLVASLVTSAVGAVAVGAMTRSLEVLILSLSAPLILGGASVIATLRRKRLARRDRNTYRDALTKAEAELSLRGRKEAVRLRWTNPDAVELVRRLECGAPAPRTAAPLQARIGLGDRPVEVAVGVDPHPPGWAIAPLAPVTLGLVDDVLRVGGDREAAARLIRWILVQICAGRPADQLVVTLILDPERDADWAWTRWLPHLASRTPKRTLGPIVSSAAHHLVVIDCADLAEHSDEVLRREIGGAAIVLAASSRFSGAARQVLASGNGVLEHRLGDGTTSTSICDGIDTVLAERAARLIAAGSDQKTHDNASDASVLDLAGTPDADAIVSRWASNDGSAISTVGIEEGQPFSIDLCADGPHALIVGTTGSGKSELLQTLVAGLCLRYPPDELSLALIDYKGGATFGRLRNLPHVSSVVTDLDHGAASRALLSLQAELRRRETLFACAGVDSLPGYRNSQHAPVIPRLVIVVDEFAALVSDQSDLLDGLVSVAQRGRSLGVHLVLATQRSGGAIAQDIRSNASLRIALRMEDVTESRDLVGSGDAALICSDRPGDAIARTATGLHRVHIARAFGNSANIGVQVVPLGPWRTLTTELTEARKSDVDDVITIVREAASRAGVQGHEPPWLPPLPASLSLTDVGDVSHSVVVPIGLADRPERQEQTVVEADLGTGLSFLFAGSPRSGRTTALTTLARSAAARLSPAELSIYVVDANGGGLTTATDEIAHVATACSAGDPTHVARLVQRLHLELRRRQTRSVAASSVEATKTGTALLLVDGFDRLTTALDAFDGGATSIALGDLISLGPPCGLSVAMTADVPTAARCAPAFGAVFAMGAHASAALCRRSNAHAKDVLLPGRGTRMSDGAAVQIAIAADSHAAHRWNDAGVADDRIIVRPLPESVRLESIDVTPRVFVLGVGGDEATPVAVDLVRYRARLLVGGPPASGKSTTLIALLAQAMSMGLPVGVAARVRSPLAAAAADFGLSAVSPDETHPPLDCEGGLLLIDDVDQLVDSRVEGALTAIIRSTRHACAVVASGDATSLSLLQRGAAAELRRSRTGLLLQPRQIDGDLFGVRLPRSAPTATPGRGLLVPDPTWFPTREPISIQIAVPATYTYPMCG